MRFIVAMLLCLSVSATNAQASNGYATVATDEEYDAAAAQVVQGLNKQHIPHEYNDRQNWKEIAINVTPIVFILAAFFVFIRKKLLG